MARKQIAQTTCHRIEQADFDPSEFLKATEFFGQRPWRQHHQSKEQNTLDDRSDVNAGHGWDRRVTHSLQVELWLRYKKVSASFLGVIVGTFNDTNFA